MLKVNENNECKLSIIYVEELSFEAKYHEMTVLFNPGIPAGLT